MWFLGDIDDFILSQGLLDTYIYDTAADKKNYADAVKRQTDNLITKGFADATYADKGFWSQM